MIIKHFCFVLTIFAPYCSGGQASTCHNTKIDWETACAQQYNGVANGGRCFFALNTTGDWTESWQSCANRGGTLAQIHTGQEFANITTYVKDRFAPGTPVWIALYSSVQSIACGGLSEKVFWHENVTGYDSKLTYGNTWVRNHVGDDCPNPGEDLCFGVFANRVGDYYCYTKMNPLCVVTNKNQNFTMINNACFAEHPIETLTTIDSKSCAKECVDFGWCRGFNFWVNNYTCQLFSWAFDKDDIYGAKSTPATDCYAYSYLP